MNQNQLAKALLTLELGPERRATTDQIDRIMEADQRRVGRWMRICVCMWIVAAVGAIVLFVVGGLAFPVIAKMLEQSGEGSLENPDTPFLALAKLVAVSMVLGTASFMLLVIAGVSTVLLQVHSRRATLRQINSNLIEISRQLENKWVRPLC